MNPLEYWNSVAETKTFTTPFMMEAFGKYVPKEARILDVGCGYGRILKTLHAAGYENATGFDFSEELLERGRREFPELDLRGMPSDAIPVPDASSDAVLLCAVLTCIVENEAQTALIREVSRVLKPGGILYINDFLINSDDRNRERYAACPGSFPYGVFELPEGTRLRHHDRPWLDTLLEPFTQLVFEPCVYTTMNGHRSEGFYYLGSKK